MSAAESKLLEVAGAESRLSLARIEVRTQVEALRSAMAAGAPLMSMQRALLVWRFSVSLKGQGVEMTPGPPDAIPSSPAGPRPAQRRPGGPQTGKVALHQCRRAWSAWRKAQQLQQRRRQSVQVAQVLLARKSCKEQLLQLAMILGSWLRLAEPAKRTAQLLKAEAARHVASAKRTMEAAEKAVLLTAVLKAWADWSGAEQAERWLDLFQAEGRCLRTQKVALLSGTKSGLGASPEKTGLS